MKYEKPPLTSSEHVGLLKERGLIIPNEERARRYFENISYFRLAGYMFHFQSKDGQHNFKEGTTFNDVLLVYQFDKKLRFLLLDYLERIEVALRAQLSNIYSINHGFFWYTKSKLYKDYSIYEQINIEIASKFEKPQELYLKRYKSRYYSETLPPSNMAIEVLTLGKLSRLFSGLKNEDEIQQISSHFKLPFSILVSWFMYLTYIRNICAHHSRLWNKSLTVDRPIIPSRKKYKFDVELPENFNTSLYGVVALIDRILSAINENNSMVNKIESLLNSHPSIDDKLMGFPEGWRDNPVWGKK